jgi:hypothetical protein
LRVFIAVTRYLEGEFGLARTSGTIMAKDCVTPICLHYWNVLPDFTIVDMTADQLMEGSDFRIIPKSHPDWYRYQPEFDDYEDTHDLLGKGIYSDVLIELIVQTGRRLERASRERSGYSKDYLHAEPASEKVKSSLEPLITEFFQKCLSDNIGQQAYIKRHSCQDTPGMGI